MRFSGAGLFPADRIGLPLFLDVARDFEARIVLEWLPDLLYLLHLHFANCPLYIRALKGVRLETLKGKQDPLRGLELVLCQHDAHDLVEDQVLRHVQVLDNGLLALPIGRAGGHHWTIRRVQLSTFSML